MVVMLVMVVAILVIMVMLVVMMVVGAWLLLACAAQDACMPAVTR